MFERDRRCALSGATKRRNVQSASRASVKFVIVNGENKPYSALVLKFVYRDASVDQTTARPIEQ